MDDRKSSTMSSIFIGSTLEKPNVELIINAVATILHSQMLEVNTKMCNLFRTLVKARKSHLRAIFSSSLRKSIFWRNQKPSINKELHY